MATRVTGEQAKRIMAKVTEIMRQIYLQEDGYPSDPDELEAALQDVIEGKFGDYRRRAKKSAKPTTPTPILKRLRTVSLPAIARFDGSTLQTGTVDGVKIWVTKEFAKVFGGKVENNLPAIELVVHKLTQNSRDSAIITAIGGDDLVEISLGHLWELIKRQPQGKDGDLLTTSWNVFYVRDMGYNLCAVGVLWCGTVWGLYVYSIERRRGWVVDDRVFSYLRNVT